jgi:hypothetical protein
LLDLSVAAADGALATSDVEKAARILIEILRKCCDLTRQGGKNLPSTLLVALRTDEKGRVIESSIQNPPPDLDPSFRFCIERTFKGLKLAGAGTARVVLKIR